MVDQPVVALSRALSCNATKSVSHGSHSCTDCFCGDGGIYIAGNGMSLIHDLCCCALLLWIIISQKKEVNLLVVIQTEQRLCRQMQE